MNIFKEKNETIKVYPPGNEVLGRELVILCDK